MERDMSGPYILQQANHRGYSNIKTDPPASLQQPESLPAHSPWERRFLNQWTRNIVGTCSTNRLARPYLGLVSQVFANPHPDGRPIFTKKTTGQMIWNW